MCYLSFWQMNCTKTTKNLYEEWKSNQTRRAKKQTASPGLCTWSYHVCLIHKMSTFHPLFFSFHNYCQYRYIVTLFQYISRTSFHCRKEHILAWTIFLLIISEQINDLISYRQSDMGREWWQCTVEKHRPNQFSCQALSGTANEEVCVASSTLTCGG